MDLEEFQKQLYREKGELKKDETPSGLGLGQREAGSDEQGAVSWEKEPSKVRPPFFSEKRKKIFKVGIIAVTLAALTVAGLFFVFRQRFDRANVSLKVFGRDRVVSGEDVSYLVEYKNNTNVVLKNVKLTFFYPAGALPINAQNLQKVGDGQISGVILSDLAPGQAGKQEFRASLSGSKDEKKKATAILSYQPGKNPSRFESSAEFESVIFLVPLVLSFDLPEKTVSGQSLTFALKYLNTSDIAFSDLTLKAEYPEGFSFISSSPAPQDNLNNWLIGEIGPKEEGKILIAGSLNGNQGEVKTFRAKVEKAQDDAVRALAENLSSTLISLPPLAVKLELNSSRDYIINVSDELNYRLTYQNTADVAIGPVFINVKLDDKVLDLASLKPGRGSFNSISSTITWNESVLPELRLLEPDAKAEIEFAVKAKSKEKLAIKNFSDKNFTAPVSVKIDSANIPISLRGTQISGEDSLNNKLNSKLSLTAKGFYQDAKMPNSGPIPPKVGQTTTYTIYWDVANLANDIDDVIIESYLPPYITWPGNFSPLGANIKYDKNSGKISWTLGRLAANTGTLYPVKELAFQIGLTPSSLHLGERVELVKPLVIRGKDTFTGQLLEAQVPAVTTNLPDDPNIGYGGDRVVQ